VERPTRALAWTAILLAVVTFILLHPILLPLVLAAWFARLVRPIRDRLPFRPGLSAALLTLLLLLLVIGPVLLLLKFLGQGALGLADAVASSKGLRGAFESLVSPSVQPINMHNVQRLFEKHTADAESAFPYAILLGLGAFIFFFFLGLGSISLIGGGERLYAWVRAHQPMRPEHFDRLGAAFTETGRGLFVSIGLTCLTQGVLCTITFLALGIPRAGVLGFICALFAVLPVVGTPLVWGPVAAGLFLTGATTKAVILIAVGVGAIGVIEEIVGPMFARLGRLQLSPGLILVGMFGGTLGLGPSGLFLGPLVLRLAKEALECCRDQGLSS
jgi:predicted PurR-regulated permease PerM